MKHFYLFTYKVVIKRLLAVFFIIGIVLGTLMANFGKGIYLGSYFLFDDTYLASLKDANINCFVVTQMALFKYLKSFGLLLLMLTTMLGVPYMLLFTTYKGLSIGFVAATAMMKYGVSGIWFFLGYYFPHYMIIIPVLLFVFFKGYDINYNLYARGEHRRMSLSTYIPIIGLIILLIFVASLMEGYINTSLIRTIMLNLS